MCNRTKIQRNGVKCSKHLLNIVDNVLSIWMFFKQNTQSRCSNYKHRTHIEKCFLWERERDFLMSFSVLELFVKKYPHKRELFHFRFRLAQCESHWKLTKLFFIFNFYCFKHLCCSNFNNFEFNFFFSIAFLNDFSWALFTIKSQWPNCSFLF